MTSVVIAPDSFKGTLPAPAVADAIARGWASVRPNDELVLRPMADGGEGTLEAFAGAGAGSGSTRMTATVAGPDGTPVDADWLLLADGTAVVELARSSGLHLLDPLQPLDAHTIGFGELIVAALDAGATRLVLGIGGSASTDGGAGMLSALGARFLDAQGEPVSPGNRGLEDIASVDLSGLRSAPPGSLALSDVTNPLFGPRGAAFVFGPQKGANPDKLAEMDARLRQLAAALGLEALAAESGAGAAGGVGFGLLAWGVPLAAGARTVGELIGLPEAIAAADLVITGEGRYDEQTASGKVAHYVGSQAEAARVPIALVAGSIAAPTHSFVGAVSLTVLAGSASAAMGDPARWLIDAGASLSRSYTGR